MRNALLLALSLSLSASAAQAANPATNADFDLRARASVAANSYTTLGAFAADVDGDIEIISFTDLANGALVGNAYVGSFGVAFDSDDTVFSAGTGTFVTDGVGVNANGRTTLQIPEGASAIGVDFPGALTIEGYDDAGNPVGISSDFAGGGTGFFGGIIFDAPATTVVLRDWVDDAVFYDNLYLVQVADPCAVDADGDGFSECDGDCDDFDPSVNPGSPDVPGDGLDNDCDGMVDESTGSGCPAGGGATGSGQAALSSLLLCLGFALRRRS